MNALLDGILDSLRRLEGFLELASREAAILKADVERLREKGLS